MSSKNKRAREKRLPIHPAADIFPEMPAAEYAALKTDIERHGLRQPIVLWQGQLVDGRHRKLACDALGIQPRTVELPASADPWAYVVSANLHRRHLDESQRAMVAARLRKQFDRAAKQRQVRKPKSVPANLPEQKGDSRDQAGKALGVGGKSVDSATKVLKSNKPELIKAVDSGELAVSKAAQLVKTTAAPAEPAEPVDEVGNKLPRSLQQAFRDAGQFTEILSQISALKKSILELAASPAGGFVHSQSTLADLQNVRAAIRFGRPYAVCPYCRGKSCRGCKQRGWLPKERYETAKKAEGRR